MPFIVKPDAYCCLFITERLCSMQSSPKKVTRERQEQPITVPNTNNISPRLQSLFKIIMCRRESDVLTVTLDIEKRKKHFDLKYHYAACNNIIPLKYYW